MFQQVARKIRARILSGELAPGEFLPPEKTLAYDLDVSVWVIGAALEELRRQGYIAPSTPGRRARVAEQVEPVRVPLQHPADRWSSLLTSTGRSPSTQRSERCSHPTS